MASWRTTTINSLHLKHWLISFFFEESYFSKNIWYLSLTNKLFNLACNLVWYSFNFIKRVKCLLQWWRILYIFTSPPSNSVGKDVSPNTIERSFTICFFRVASNLYNILYSLFTVAQTEGTMFGEIQIILWKHWGEVPCSPWSHNLKLYLPNVLQYHLPPPIPSSTTTHCCHLIPVIQSCCLKPLTFGHQMLVLQPTDNSFVSLCVFAAERFIVAAAAVPYCLFILCFPPCRYFAIVSFNTFVGISGITMLLKRRVGSACRTPVEIVRTRWIATCRRLNVRQMYGGQWSCEAWPITTRFNWNLLKKPSRFLSIIPYRILFPSFSR